MLRVTTGSIVINTDASSTPSNLSYHLYSQVHWIQEWGVTPEIPKSFTIPPSVLWGVGNYPKACFPANEELILTAEDLARIRMDSFGTIVAENQALEESSRD